MLTNFIVDKLFYRKVNVNNYPKLKLIFILVDTNLPHFRTRSHLSIAIPPSVSSSYAPSSIEQPPTKSSSSIPTSIALPPSKSHDRAPTKIWKHGFEDSPIAHHKHHYSRRKNRNPAPVPTSPIQAPTYSSQGLILSP
jgi:hypothetical protein